ncbi:hypothetical protein ACQP3C_30890, partial [Escherichia coli]
GGREKGKKEGWKEGGKVGWALFVLCLLNPLLRKSIQTKLAHAASKRQEKGNSLISPTSSASFSPEIVRPPLLFF